MKLKIITVSALIEENDCDYITLDIADSKKGAFSGSYGIKKGHAEAVFSLRDGTVTAKRSDKAILSVRTCSGFATVKDNTVTVTADSAELLT